ncbi:hypothetical protein C8R43DRAFT_1013174 [Mycena crocata]|nr:hypothetical protein C8R43DRAFT_1013174 [Mycena crocata]
MAWYHAQFTSRRFNPYTPNPVGLTTLPNLDAAKKTTAPDSLFGPNIGPVQPGPAWTSHTQPKRLVDADELTTDTVRAWIEKSKIPTTATTTLQAQVNLRRPTLRLSPLAPGAGVNVRDAPHLIEFQFDCAAPKCGVHVNVLLPPSHPDAPAHGGALQVFEAVVPGGFAQALGPSDAAVIELARFERLPAVAASSSPATSAAVPTTPAAAPERKRFTPFHFRRRNATASTTSATPATPATPLPGAALAVVEEKKDESDNDDPAGVRVTIRLVALDEAGRELDAPNEQTVYLVVGRLGAAHSVADVTPAAAAASTTTPAAAASSTTTPAEEKEVSDADKDASADKDKDANAKEEKEAHAEKDAAADADADPRPWLVRVVKREATIGPHTFHLHEIYGLSSAAAPAPTPAATASAPATYPPQPPADDPPERECLLCLSAPREVGVSSSSSLAATLVACRPCAVNMVEFGAGGAIVAEEASEPAPVVAPVPATTTTPASPAPTTTAPAPTTTAPAAAGAGAEAAEGAPAEGGEGAAGAAADAGGVAPSDGVPAAEGAQAQAPAVVTPAPVPTPAPTAARRKRKAKGWFCPVCRQPYTSLLRITTAPPPVDAVAPMPNSPTSPGGNNEGAATGTNEGGNGEEGGGILGGLSGLRPAFLRGLSIRDRARPADVEAQ